MDMVVMDMSEQSSEPFWLSLTTTKCRIKPKKTLK